MGGFIIFPDGRAWAPNNWGFDEGIAQIAATLLARPEGRELGTWLLEQRNAVLGSGLGSVEVGELTPANQELLLDAIEATFPRRDPKPVEWYRLENVFQLLSYMVAAYRRAEPPMDLNPNMRALIPPSGRRAGPGWDHL